MLRGCRGLSLAVRVQGATKVGAHTRFRAVGHRKGSKQLLNTSAGLVRTVVRNELIVHGAVSSSGFQRTNDHSEFFRTIIRSSLRTTELRAENSRMRGIFHVTVRVVLRTENSVEPENSMPGELIENRKHNVQISYNPERVKDDN